MTGSNYAGVFLAVESYCNDVFDNTILGSEWYAIECHSNMFNSMPNNIMDQEILNLYARRIHKGKMKIVFDGHGNCDISCGKEVR